MKFKVFKFKKVTSTNTVAMKLIKKEKEEIGLIYASRQTKGKGRYGKKWISKEGNLFASIFFHLQDKHPSFKEFVIINPIIISDIIKNYCKAEKISYKWPNDLFVRGKKICGILQEIITLKNKKFLIIGIGINILSNPKIKTKYEATNILKECKKKPSIKRIVKEIIKSYEKFFINLNTYKYKNFEEKAKSMILN